MFEKILVALDESVHAKTALETTIAMAKGFGAEVRVVHVLETGFVGRAGSVNLESADEAHRVVNDALATLESASIKASGTVRAGMHGRLAVEINLECIESGASAMVVGTRGLSEFEGIFVGSTSHRLLHLSRVPVIVVP